MRAYVSHRMTTEEIRWGPGSVVNSRRRWIGPISNLMISLRKAMDQQRDELLQSALDCCRGVVASVAQNGARVCPPVADTFQQNLINLCEHLSAAAAPGEVSKTEHEIGRELEGWARAPATTTAAKPQKSATSCWP